MKNLKKILSLFTVITLFISCNDDDNDLSFVDNVVAPSNVTAHFKISQDNTGNVVITPNSEGGVSYEVYFGDESEPETVESGSNVQHTYPVEGTYTIGIIATGITGLKTVASKELPVYFVPPENLVIDAQIDSSNPFVVNVSATADFAASFLVYFDTSNPNEVPTELGLDETVSYEYPGVGDYTIKVVALSGGAETTEATEVVTIQAPTVLPIDFEIFDATVFQGFGGASNAVIPNPDTSGNGSATVGQIVKNGPEVWAGNVITLSSPMDFSTQKALTLDVWSPRPGGNLLVKLENLNDGGIFIEKQVTLTGNSSWESVSVDFSDIDETIEYQKIVLFFDFGLVGDGSADWTFYIDNIDQDFVGAVAPLMIEDFEGTPPTFTVFGNIADTEVIANPDMSGINTSANVAQLTKSSGSEVWAGTFFEVPTPLNLSAYGNIRVKTWSPATCITVKMKLENVDASITHEVDVQTKAANKWEELVYDFSGAPAADYVRIVMFFDFGNAGDDSLYYYDDIELVGPPLVDPLAFQDFEGAAPTFTVFGNIADTQVIANPDVNCINPSANVAQLTKTSGSEVWAGTFFETATPLDLNSFTKISVKTWSPSAGVVVKVKLENVDASITHEVDLNSTVANSWEELVYDFSGAPAADYIRVVIFFDFGNAGDDSAYYFDEYTLTN